MYKLVLDASKQIPMPRGTTGTRHKQRAQKSKISCNTKEDSHILRDPSVAHTEFSLN